MANLLGNVLTGSCLIAGSILALGCATESAGDSDSVDTVKVTQPVLSLPYSSEGKFEVYEGASGELAVSISGSLGTADQQKLDSVAASPSLVDMYRAVSGLDAPADLSVLSERYGKERAIAAALNSQVGEPTLEGVEGQAAVDSDKSFNSQACITISGYNTIGCWSGTCPNLAWGNCGASSPQVFLSGDCSFGWNNTAVAGYHEARNITVALPKYQYRWTCWKYNTPNYPPNFYSPYTSVRVTSATGGLNGDVGVTIHRLVQAPIT